MPRTSTITYAFSSTNPKPQRSTQPPARYKSLPNNPTPSFRHPNPPRYPRIHRPNFLTQTAHHRNPPIANPKARVSQTPKLPITAPDERDTTTARRVPHIRPRRCANSSVPINASVRKAPGRTTGGSRISASAMNAHFMSLVDARPAASCVQCLHCRIRVDGAGRGDGCGLEGEVQFICALLAAR